MKKQFLFIAILLLSGSLFAQQAGELDPNFGNSGRVQVDSAVHEAVGVMTIQPDGKILLGGFVEDDGGHQYFTLLRRLPNGQPDPGFGDNGMVRASVGEWDNVVTGLAVQPDGKIVMVGYTTLAQDYNEDYLIIRFLPDGSIDTDFGGNDGTSNGVISVDLSLQDRPSGVMILDNGKILVAGSASNQSNIAEFILVQFLADGSLDVSFGNGGAVDTQVGPTLSYCHDMFRQPDGKIVLVGEAAGSGGNADFAVARYWPNGSLDSTFSADGQVTTTVGQNRDIAFAGALQPDGKIVVAGIANKNNKTNFALVRYKADGQLDTGFGNNGRATALIGTTYSAASDLAILPDGKILVVGTAANSGTLYDFALAQFNANGSLDAGFGNNGAITTDIDSHYDGAGGSLLQDDGKLLVAGSGVNTQNPYTDMIVLRYLTALNVGLIDAPTAIIQPLIYPNPLSGITVQVRYELKEADKVVFELLGTDGKILGTLGAVRREAGQQHEELLLPADLPNGFYLLNIRTGQGNAVVKIELQRS